MWGRGVLVLFLSIFLILSFGFVIANHEEGHIDSVDGEGEVVRVDGESKVNDQVDEGGFPPECAVVDCLQGYHCVAGGSCVLDSEGDFDEELFEELEEEHKDAVLTDPGITPDSAFYFIDEFFDRFGSDLENREEKIAELRAMIEEGNFEAAREALESYRRHAESWEEDADPNERDEARRSAAAIHTALRGVEDDIPEEFHRDFFEDVLEIEGRLVTAVEISSKIKELCEALSELDPLEYSRVCRTDDSDADWHRALDRDLTEEQKQEAEAFFEIMSQCFETSGAQCRCEDISFTEFAEVCAIVAPLEAKCDAGDENSCDLVDELTEDIEDLLPEYLIDILDDLIDEFEDDVFDHYGGPRECEGITDRAQCEELIFRNNAPPECVEELLDRRGIEFTREYAIGEAQRDCEEIMFRLYAPQECTERGITDFRECGVLMFRLNAPQECIDAGLTGENRGDERKCAELVGDGGFGDRRGIGGANCREISDPERRLACYDSAVQGTHDRFDDRDDFYDDYQETRDLERQCAETCSAEGGAWSFSDGVCDCRFDVNGGQGPHGRFQTPYSQEFADRCALEGGLVDCDGDYCDCVFEAPGVCPDVYEPVCGVDDKTYSNECFAKLEGVVVDCEGECPCAEPPTDTSNTTTGTGSIIAIDNEFFNYRFR